MTKGGSAMVERFAEADLSGLREDLMKSGLDSWQAADLISTFLASRGYGVSMQDARAAAFGRRAGCSNPASKHSRKSVWRTGASTWNGGAVRGGRSSEDPVA